jgi:hypothetical protein
VTIDPLAPLGGGQYRDRLVTVVNGAAELPATDVKVAATISFELRRRGWQLVVRHRVPDSSIDDSLTTLINEELFVPGWVSGNAVFESIFTGVVVTSRPDPLDAWVLFYTNTMRHYVDAALDDSSAEPSAQQALSSFIEIHREVDALVPRGASVLELGACFGFLSLFLSRLPTREVIASDISVGTMRLLSAVAGRLHVAVDTLVADAARIPRPDSSVDVVLIIHLLEHLEPRRSGWRAGGSSSPCPMSRRRRRRTDTSAPSMRPTCEPLASRLPGGTSRCTRSMAAGWFSIAAERCANPTMEGPTVSADLDQAHLAGQVDGLGPPGHAQLPQDVPHMKFDGRIRDEQFLADLDIRHPAG